jgi:hypothetical protein
MPSIYYPPATRGGAWFYDTYRDSVFAGGVEKVVWHTTEGSGWPAYDGGAKAPHLTAYPDFSLRRLIWRQHFPLNVYSRALRNEPGGVQTNLDGAVQVELIGTSDTDGPGLYWPNAPEWALRDLAKFAVFMHKQYGVPLRAAPLWLPYPKSYGSSGGQRFSGGTWDRFRGHCGHQHVPENSHGDPGDTDIKRVMIIADAMLQAETAVPPPPPPAPVPTPPKRSALKESDMVFIRALGTQPVYGVSLTGTGYKTWIQLAEYTALGRPTIRDLPGDHPLFALPSLGPVPA